MASLLAKLAATIVVAGALLAGLLLPWVGGTGLVARNSASLLDALPVELTDKTPAGNSRVLAADGSLITNFYTNNRTPVAADQISAVMKQALVDIEDSRFYEHNGLDVQGTLRALVTQRRRGLGAGGRLDAHPAAGQADPAADGGHAGGAARRPPSRRVGPQARARPGWPWPWRRPTPRTRSSPAT